MKRKVLLLFLVLVLVVLAAALAYPRLSERYRILEGQPSSQPTEAPAVSETVSTVQTTETPAVSTTVPTIQPTETPAATVAPTLPDFTVDIYHGGLVRLSDFYGKPIVVNFWTTWCVYCVKELPAFQEAYNKYGDEVVFLMVNLPDGARETKAKAKAFLDENGYTFPVYYDTQYSASTAYSIRSIPVTLFVDASGTSCETQLGAMNKEALIAKIQALVQKTN